MINCIVIPKTTSYNPALEYMEIDNYRFHIKDVGNKDNPPTVIIHGGPGGDFHYLLPLENLADKFHILFYDQRMTGLSPRKSDKAPSLEQDIEDLHRIVEKFTENQKVILIGHSYGAMIAAGYLVKYPETVSKAVIIEPGILTKETAKEFIKRLKSKTSFISSLGIIGPLIKSIFVKTEDGDERFDYVMTKMLGSGSGQPYQCDGVSLPENSFVRGGFNVFNSTMRPMMGNVELFTADLVTGLKNFPRKILLLSSSCSFIGYDYQETFHKAFFPTNTEHIRLNNTGHNFISTDSEKGIPIIRDFLIDNFYFFPDSTK